MVFNKDFKLISINFCSFADSFNLKEVHVEI